MNQVLAPPIHFLSIRNQTQVHDVFRGKEPWVILCKKKHPDYNSVYGRFETASRTLTELARFGVIDCSGSLPSGKSITQKFGLTVRGQFFFRSDRLVADALVLVAFRNTVVSRGLVAVRRMDVYPRMYAESFLFSIFKLSYGAFGCKTENKILFGLVSSICGEGGPVKRC